MRGLCIMAMSMRWVLASASRFWKTSRKRWENWGCWGCWQSGSWQSRSWAWAWPRVEHRKYNFRWVLIGIRWSQCPCRLLSPKLLPRAPKPRCCGRAMNLYSLDRANLHRHGRHDCDHRDFHDFGCGCDHCEQGPLHLQPETSRNWLCIWGIWWWNSGISNHVFRWALIPEKAAMISPMQTPQPSSLTHLSATKAATKAATPPCSLSSVNSLVASKASISTKSCCWEGSFRSFSHRFSVVVSVLVEILILIVVKYRDHSQLVRSLSLGIEMSYIINGINGKHTLQFFK